MNDLENQCFCVLDHYALFISLARRLAESGARVLYQTPVDRYDRINEAFVGGGFEGVEWVEEFWPHFDDINTFVFPDIRHQGLQDYLRSRGKAVWGSQAGMELEQDRRFFLEKLEELGLDVPPHEYIKGLSNLGAYLKDKKDIFIKVSKWRGTWETSHWRSWEEDWQELDNWAVKLGGVKEHIEFICFTKIDTDLEIGADTYCIDGQWPETVLHGIEKKDNAYLSAVTPYAEMPEELTHIMEAFSPVLRRMCYRCQFSMEARVTDDKVFFIDWTARGGLPSTATQLRAKNFPEIIHHGSRGELVQPEYDFKFSAECMVNGRASDGWMTAVLKPEVKEALLAQQCMEIDGQLWYPPGTAHKGSGTLGWLCTTGDTLEETVKNIKALAEDLPAGCTADITAIADVLKEIQSEEKDGIRFTDQPVPEPAIVLE